MTSQPFNLDPPPHFFPFDAKTPVEFYRRHLPHWRQTSTTYSVTFRLADSLPQEKLRHLRMLREQFQKEHPEPVSQAQWQKFNKQQMTLTEKWLDQGLSECLFSRQDCCQELKRSILHFQHEKYFVGSFVIMPNHCHILIRPTDDHSLENLIGSIKGIASRNINKLRNATGSIWQSESYDQIVRDEEHLYRIVQYIGNNPRKAGLSKSKWFRFVHPDWEACGWGFREP